MTGSTAYIAAAVPGASRQETPPKVTCDTCWPAPKQSKTVQPFQPDSRSRAWMPHRKSVWRLVHGWPPGLSTGKSAEAANGRATQHSPKQLAQSGTRLTRVLGRSAMATILRAGLRG